VGRSRRPAVLQAPVAGTPADCAAGRDRGHGRKGAELEYHSNASAGQRVLFTPSPEGRVMSSCVDLKRLPLTRC